MMIIFMVIVWVVSAIVGFVTYKAIYNIRKERSNRAFANLPNEMLLQYALMDPILSTRYYMYRVHMTEELAANLIVNDMLIKMGLIGYREESE